MIKRDYYLNQIIDRMWNGNIKVITGIRRGGKSTLLFKLFKDYLISSGVPNDNIIGIALDLRKNYKFRNPIFLCDYVQDIVENNADKKYYLLIDEVQFTITVKDKESGVNVTIYDMLNELKSYDNLDCYVTGSNSKMLSSDIATEFRGRSSQIRVFPLSFEEFYSWRGGVISEALNEYMIYGGMPGLIEENTDLKKRSYLKNLYDEIYMRDLVEHAHIKREDIMNEILDYLASQVGSLTNASKIAGAINTKTNNKITDDTISKYVKHAIDAFLISEAKRYDVKGKMYFEYPNKYYYEDIGLRNARLGYRQFETGHIMENIIYNELIKRGYQVDVGVIEDRRNGAHKIKEIDFVVNYFDKRIYIQSAYKMDGEDKANSELDSLTLTGDFFKKIIIRNDILTSFHDDNGILHVNLAEFLLGKIELF